MTQRETIMAALIAQIQAVPGMPNVERSIGQAFTSEESPVVVVHRGSEVPNYGQVGVVDRTCEVLVSVISKGANPEADADAIHAMTHPVVMGIRLGGIMDVSEIGTDAPSPVTAEYTRSVISMRYQIKYRTQGTSL